MGDLDSYRVYRRYLRDKVVKQQRLRGILATSIGSAQVLRAPCVLQLPASVAEPLSLIRCIRVPASPAFFLFFLILPSSIASLAIYYIPLFLLLSVL